MRGSDTSYTLEIWKHYANGSKIRLKGFGVPGRTGKPAGDLYAVIDVEVPEININ